MFSDGVLALERPAPGPGRRLTASFCSAAPSCTTGSTATRGCGCCAPRRPTTPARSPATALMSINSALQVDLFAQANAAASTPGSTPASAGRPTSSSAPCTHRAGTRYRAAVLAPEGRRLDGRAAAAHGPVTSFQHSHRHRAGSGRVIGHDERSQAAQVIENAAHPRVREELWEEAFALGLAARTWAHQFSAGLTSHRCCRPWRIVTANPRGVTHCDESPSPAA